MSLALVTGASKGIGRATALALGESGFTVGLVARSEEGLEATRRLLDERGAYAVTAPADVTQPNAVRTAVALVEQQAGPIEVLVNNAGSLGAIGPLWEVDAAAWWTDVQTTLLGAFNLCREVVPGMIERRRGRIVNVTSYAGMRPAPYQSGYACGKSALTNLTESLAASLAEHDVKVFGVAPGFTRTEMTDRLTTSAEGRRWLPEAGAGGDVDPARSADLITALATGAADELAGRVIHALDDLRLLRRNIDEIRSADLYVPRLRRLPER